MSSSWWGLHTSNYSTAVLVLILLQYHCLNELKLMLARYDNHAENYLQIQAKADD